MEAFTHNPHPGRRPAWGELLGVAAVAGLAALAAKYLTKEEFEMALKAAQVFTDLKAHDDRQKAQIADLTGKLDAVTAERDALKADADAEQAGLVQMEELANADAPAPTDETIPAPADPAPTA